MRTWTATIRVEDIEIEATLSDRDLKADQLKQAVADVAALAPEYGISQIQLFKTTKSKGTVADSWYTTCIDKRGRFIVQ